MDFLSDWIAANWVEGVGYLGTFFTIATYAMKTMIPLRIAGIASSVAFIAYGFITGSYPVVLTEAILLPLNTLRLYQMLQLVKNVESAATGNLSLDWLKPYTHQRSAKAGEILFRQGDQADQMFFTLSGRFNLVEAGIEIGPGQVLGELGLVSLGNRRTLTLECVEDGELLTITYREAKELYYQNPQFGFYFLQLIGARLLQNVERAEAKTAAAEARALAAEAALAETEAVRAALS